MQLTILTRIVPLGLSESAAVIHLAGMLDSAAAPHLHHRLALLIDAGHRHLVIDLSRVDSADAAGLAVLAAAHREVSPHGHGLHLAGADQNLRRLLRNPRTADLPVHLDLAAVFNTWPWPPPPR